MNTFSINKILKNEKGFVGTFARDEIPYKVGLGSFLVVNTDSSEKPGEHWIALAVNKDGSGEYFDSYGLLPLHIEFADFLFRNCPNGWNYNKVPLQCLECITCGHYCVVYIKLRSRGYSYCDYISLFTKNPNDNDKLIKFYLNKFD
jgi:hypothetical protein